MSIVIYLTQNQQLKKKASQKDYKKENTIIQQPMHYGFIVLKKEKNVKALGLSKETLADIKAIAFTLQIQVYVKNCTKSIKLLTFMI